MNDCGFCSRAAAPDFLGCQERCDDGSTFIIFIQIFAKRRISWFAVPFRAKRMQCSHLESSHTVN